MSQAGIYIHFNVFNCFGITRHLSWSLIYTCWKFIDQLQNTVSLYYYIVLSLRVQTVLIRYFISRFFEMQYLELHLPEPIHWIYKFEPLTAVPCSLHPALCAHTHTTWTREPETRHRTYVYQSSAPHHLSSPPSLFKPTIAHITYWSWVLGWLAYTESH
jgi:hypothetical protein